MKKLPPLFISVAIFLSLNTSANVRLIATTEAGNPGVTLRWNMVNYPGPTAYTLFKSEDGLAWTVAAANPVFRNYTAATTLAYSDNFSDEQKLYYRVKVYDANENIVSISNTEVVDNPKTNYRVHSSSKPGNNLITSESLTKITGNQWQIFPNPVRDMLNLVYRGNEIIKGVINLTIQDAAGKVVVRFRASSNNKQLHVSVSNLHAGIYFIKMNVLNQIQMNEKFIKQ